MQILKIKCATDINYYQSHSFIVVIEATQERMDLFISGNVLWINIVTVHI